jgi:hypothetical protein
MSVLQDIKERLGRLKSTDAQVRDVAAAEIADCLEADGLTPASLGRVLRTLMKFALAENDASARESLFNALSTAAEVSDTSMADWDPIAARMHELPVDCLEHVLVILGFSGNRKYRVKIKDFLSHTDDSIRSSAQDAFEMLAPDAGSDLKAAQRRN